MRHFNLPQELQPYYQSDGYFLMDHGDVYYGSFREFDEHPQSLFIVQPAHRRQLNELMKPKRTLEEIKKLAWEIQKIRRLLSSLQRRLRSLERTTSKGQGLHDIFEARPPETEETD